jgi:hypothetical protein
MNDTYKRFGGWSKTQVLEKVKEIGNGFLDDPLEDNQNSSPTMREFLHEEEEFGDRVRFDGYLILKPRTDYRVTVDGIQFSGLGKDEMINLMEKYLQSSDDYGIDSERGTAWFWWD